MRRDRLYLDDIAEAAEAISRFPAGVSEGAFLASDLLQSAVLQKLAIIGEAAARISPEFKAGMALHPLVRHRRFPQHRRPRLLQCPVAYCLDRGDGRVGMRLMLRGGKILRQK